MQLFATGFNAWNQLCLGSCPPHDEPLDIPGFTQVAEAKHIELPVARLAHTIVRLDGQLRTAGFGLQDGQEQSGFVAEASNGEILALRWDHGLQFLDAYPSLQAWKAQTPSQSWPQEPPVKEVAAYDAGFVILHEDGTVSTMGDLRFEDCLGRNTTEEQPANEPAPVPDLAGLGERVTHVSAGGSSLAALTDSGGLYVWGRASSGTHRNRQAFAGINGMPNYTEVDGGKDVQDVALGESHAIALTTDGCVYVIGENHNGQLGLNLELSHRLVSWTKVDFEALKGQKVVAVATGPRSSFILASDIPSDA